MSTNARLSKQGRRDEPTVLYHSTHCTVCMYDAHMSCICDAGEPCRALSFVFLPDWKIALDSDADRLSC